MAAGTYPGHGLHNEPSIGTQPLREEVEARRYGEEERSGDSPERGNSWLELVAKSCQEPHCDYGCDLHRTCSASTKGSRMLVMGLKCSSSFKRQWSTTYDLWYHKHISPVLP